MDEIPPLNTPETQDQDIRERGILVVDEITDTPDDSTVKIITTNQSTNMMYADKNQIPVSQPPPGASIGDLLSNLQGTPAFAQHLPVQQYPIIQQQQPQQQQYNYDYSAYNTQPIPVDRSSRWSNAVPPNDYNYLSNQRNAGGNSSRGGGRGKGNKRGGGGRYH
jgi:hypothetical protein